MGKGKKKQFIDKKNATTFVVLSRPGTTAEGANAKEFIPVRPPNMKNKKWRPQELPDSAGDRNGQEGDEGFKGGGRAGEVGAKAGNFRADDFSLGEYGFPDDGYNYSQHFAAMGGGQYFQAAGMGDVTATNRQAKGEAKKETTLEAAKAPEPSDFDFNTAAEGQFSDAESSEQEVLKALESSEDETDDPNWVLQDDFIASALHGPKETKKVSDRVRFADADFDDDEEDDGSYQDGQYSSDEDFEGDGGIVGERHVRHFEERIGVGAGDAYLDHILEMEYGDDQMGEGPESCLRADSELRGNVFANDLGGMLGEYLKERKLRSNDAYVYGDTMDVDQKSKTLELGKQALATEDQVEVIEQVVEDQQWDCESILTTYSNVANHPKMIAAERSAKAKLAAENRHQETLKFADHEERDDGDEGEEAEDDQRVNKGERRARNESAEEKKARKNAVKEERRVAREAKKQLKATYKHEAGAQKQHVDNVPFYGKSKIPM